MYASIQIPKPTDEQVLERAPIELFRCVLNDPNFGTYGHRGQAQQGVDLCGKRNGDPSRYVGVQCKLKADGKKLTNAIIKEEVEKALTFEPPITEYFIITTAPDDAKLQAYARTLELEISNKFERVLSIQIWGWNTVEREAQKHPSALKAFMPDYTPYAERTQQGIVQLEVGQNELMRQFALFSERAEKYPAPLPSNIDQTTQANPLEKHIDAEIDGYRDQLNAGEPRVALQFLEALRCRLPGDVSGRIRFRVDANIAACFLALGEESKGIDLLIAASLHAPEEPKAIANLAFAYLMSGDWEKAESVAREGLNNHPDNAEMAGALVEAQSHDFRIKDILDGVSLQLRNTRHVKIARLYGLRRRGVLPEWHIEARKLRKEFPEEAFVSQAAAEAVFDDLIRNDNISQHRSIPSAKLSAALAAHDDLLGLWEEFRIRELPAQEGHKALFVNLVLSCDILGKGDLAVDLIDNAPADVAEDQDVCIRAAQLFFNIGNDERFRRALGRINSGPALPNFLFYDSLQRADWLAVEKFGMEYATIAESREKEITSVAVRIAKLMMFEGVVRPCEFQSIATEIKEDFRCYLIVYDALVAKGHSDEASELFGEALEKITSSNSFPARAMMAQRAASKGDWRAIPHLLDGSIETDRNSRELRFLATAYTNISPPSRRAVEFFKGLPLEIRRLVYFAEREAVFHFNRGALAQAEECYRRAIERTESDDLHLYLALLSLLLRRRKNAEADNLVRRLLESRCLRGSGEDRAMFAHFLAYSGCPSAAIDLAYSALNESRDNADVHGAYVTLVLMDTGAKGSPEMIPAADRVGLDTWVRFESEEGEQREFLISNTEDQEARHLFRIVVNPATHELARLAFGKQVGDSFSHIEAFGLNAPVWTIREIKHKYLQTLHIIMAEFETRFPGSNILGRLRIEGGDIQPVLDHVRRRGEYYRDLTSFYTKKGIPICVLASLLRITSIECASYLRSLGNKIRACSGLIDERERGIAAINKERLRGAAIDAYTALTIHEIGAFGVCRRVFGILRLPQSGLDEITKLIVDIDTNSGEKITIGWQDGRLTRTSVTGDDLQRRREFLIASHDAISSNCEIVAREAPENISDNARSFLENASEDIMDPAFCAVNGGLLLSDDMYFRQFAEQEFGVAGVWLQAVFMYAFDQGFVGIDEYTRLIAALAGRGHASLSVSAVVLAHAATLGDDGGTATFRTISSLIGTREAEIRSHLSAAYGAIFMIWSDRTLSRLRKASCIGTLLADLLRFRSEDWEMALGKIYRDSPSDLQNYIHGWVGGHFLSRERFAIGVRRSADNVEAGMSRFLRHCLASSSRHALWAGLS